MKCGDLLDRLVSNYRLHCNLGIEFMAVGSAATHWWEPLSGAVPRLRDNDETCPKTIYLMAGKQRLAAQTSMGTPIQGSVQSRQFWGAPADPRLGKIGGSSGLAREDPIKCGFLHLSYKSACVDAPYHRLQINL
jgi:hypothetical protein